MQRLIRDHGPYGEQQFEYDPVGNRLSQTTYRPGSNTDNDNPSQHTDYHYAPASNRMLGTSEKQILLDSAGNTLRESNEQQRDYHYNSQNRLSEYHEEGQLKARYHYNALGQRVHKAVIQADGSEEHTLFHYGQQGELLGETRLNGSATNQPAQTSHTQNIVWLQMRPVAALDSTNNTDTRIAWLHSDHLLTARAATDEHQRLIWRWHSGAFGVGEEESFAPKDNPSAQAFTLNLRFPGQYHDEESGLYYNYFRTYDPAKGRYTQSDPIGLAGGINTFGYVLGNPVIFADLLGLITWSGTQITFSAGEGGGAVRFQFDLVSGCIDGVRTSVRVIAGGFTLTLGMPISGSYSRSVVFEDGRSEVDPYVFQGQAEYAYASWAATFAGYSYQYIKLGEAIALGGGGQMGWDASVAMGVGVSTVTDLDSESCGC